MIYTCTCVSWCLISGDFAQNNALCHMVCRSGCILYWLFDRNLLLQLFIIISVSNSTNDLPTGIIWLV